MDITIQRIYDSKKKEIGAVLSAGVGKLTEQQKEKIENILVDFAFNEVYTGTTLKIYKERHNDNASITVIKDFNSLDQEHVNIL